jgi:hypothetical protein
MCHKSNKNEETTHCTNELLLVLLLAFHFLHFTCKLKVFLVQLSINRGFDMKSFHKPAKEMMRSMHTMRILNVLIFILIVLCIQLEPDIQHGVPRDEQVLRMHYPSSIFFVDVKRVFILFFASCKVVSISDSSLIWAHSLLAFIFLGSLSLAPLVLLGPGFFFGSFALTATSCVRRMAWGGDGGGREETDGEGRKRETHWKDASESGDHPIDTNIVHQFSPGVHSFITLSVVLLAILLMLNDVGEYVWGWWDEEFSINTNKLPVMSIQRRYFGCYALQM